jgi:pyruvate/2-oxoglutarate dehydrogenase complex dihydrolipoamide acyltransferase (E2) component
MQSIERSPSGRARCRACREKIDKDEWRYVEEEPSADFDGEVRRYWHATCAVDRRATGASRALSSASQLLPKQQWGLLLCQAVLRRSGKRKETVARPLWLTLDDDGWAHLLCELDSGNYAVVTDLEGRWSAVIERTRDDALAALPGPIFTIAAEALGAAPPTEAAAQQALASLKPQRAAARKLAQEELRDARRESLKQAKLRAKEAGVDLSKVVKRARVEIVGEVQGASKGTRGSVFWVGYTKQGTDKRVGIDGDDGRTYWANLIDVVPL